jgi:hypothetical protein
LEARCRWDEGLGSRGCPRSRKRRILRYSGDNELGGRMVLLKLMMVMSIIKTQESEDDEYASVEVKVKYGIVSVH